LSVLDRIVEATRDEVERRREIVTLSQLEAALSDRPESRPFQEALTRPGISVIAEHKRRSPAGGLRKDFIVDPYQLYESAAAGADAILLIVAALEPDALRELLREAWSLDLDVLVEVHDAEELESALEVEAEVIGINNRDLGDFSVDIERTYELLSDVPAGKTVVSESGFSTREQLDELDRVGVDAVLIGETLMRAPDLEAACRELTGGADASL
jgi:indole-3-glycerol phosphate synthase